LSWHGSGTSASLLAIKGIKQRVFGVQRHRRLSACVVVKKEQKGSYDPMELATLLNVLLAFVPTALMAVKHTMTMRDSITAYSTAVGPSSETRKRCTFRASDFMGIPPLQSAPLRKPTGIKTYFGVRRAKDTAGDGLFSLSESRFR
jgi:hypothetical protein